MCATTPEPTARGSWEAASRPRVLAVEASSAPGPSGTDRIQYNIVFNRVPFPLPPGHSPFVANRIFYGENDSHRRPESRHAAARTLPIIETELDQGRVRGRDRIGVAVRRPGHGQDLLAVDDHEDAPADNRANLGGFLEILHDRDLGDREPDADAAAGGPSEVVFELAEDFLVGGEDHDLLRAEETSAFARATMFGRPFTMYAT